MKQRRNKKLFLAGGIVAALALAVALILLIPEKQEYFWPPAPEYVPEGDVTAFRRDCVEGVLAKKAVPDTCRSYEAMRQSYGVNAPFLLEVEQGKMIMTARRIARGQIMTPGQLQACIDAGDCREIPLIPPQYHGDEKVRNSAKGRAVREVFWHLVNDGSLTPEMCAYMDICKAYVILGLVRFDNETASRP